MTSEQITVIQALISSIEEFGIATAPFISGAISSRNPKVRQAATKQCHVLTQARALIRDHQKTLVGKA